MRARNIKPGFYKNEDLAECSVWTRLIFPGLWMLADREGRLEDRPRRIKGELLPFDLVDVESLLQELKQHNFIVRYEIDGEKYIQILGFTRHQSPHYSEKESVIKPPSFLESTVHDDVSIPGVLRENSRNEASIKTGSQPPDSLNPDSLIQNILPADAGSVSGRSGDTETSSSKIPPCPIEKIIEIYHEVLIELPQVKVITDQRRKQTQARWREEPKRRNLDWWHKYFQAVHSSDFLIGRAGGTWRADFGWLVKPENLAKVIEGKYANRQGGNGQ